MPPIFQMSGGLKMLRMGGICPEYPPLRDKNSSYDLPAATLMGGICPLPLPLRQEMSGGHALRVIRPESPKSV